MVAAAHSLLKPEMDQKISKIIKAGIGIRLTSENSQDQFFDL